MIHKEHSKYVLTFIVNEVLSLHYGCAYTGLSFRILEKNSSNKKLKENQNSSDLFKKLKNIFSKTQYFGKILVPLCSNSDVTTVNFS